MNDILTGLDLPEEVKKTLSERIEEAKKGWVEGAKNNPEFIKQIRQEEAGKFFNSMEKVLKRNLDVKPDDLGDDLTGIKRQEALLKLGIKSFEQNKDKTNQDLQNELLKVKSEYKEYKEERVPELISNERQTHYSRYIDESILKDTLGFETTCNERARVSIVKSFLEENKLRKEWDADNSEYKILTKENLKFTRNDKPLSNKEIVELALEDGGVLKKSNGTPNGGNNDRNNEPIRTPGKLSANAQAMADSFK